MRPLYTALQSRNIDDLLITQTPISGYELMQRAAQACFNRLIKRWPQMRKIMVFSGIGNNGGDGYLIAHLLRQAGRDVKVCQVGDADRMKGDAAQARATYVSAGGEITTVNEKIDAELFVDALFGSGLNRDLSVEVRDTIVRINQYPAAVLSVDIPSGLDADRGGGRPIAVNADLTISFITRKRGLYTAAGKDHCGQVLFADLQCADDVTSQVVPDCWLLNHGEALQWLPPRRHNSHKKDFGHIVILGGNRGMAGAVCLAGKAALYSGGGVVGVLTQAQHSTAVTAVCPPLMVDDATHSATLKKWIHNCDVIAIGPGLGTDSWALALMAAVLDSKKPLVVDADALHLLADDPFVSEHWILTPHPGEAAHLLHTTTREIQNDRFAAARAIQSRYGGVCVLKGAGSIVADAAHTTVCEGGNAGMATAGMGDVLCGIIAALRGQGLSADQAALLGTCAHAAAGDRAAANMPRGLSADIVIDHLRAILNNDT